MRMGVAREDRAYQQLPGHAALAAALDGYLQEHNAARPAEAMQLVMFGDFAQHVARLARVLRQPRGSALLLGAGGSGKRSVARLACHVSDTQLCTLEVTRSYGLAEFRYALLPRLACPTCCALSRERLLPVVSATSTT
jgi:dynein heavy chain